MKAILISVHNQSVTQIEIEDGLDSIYKAIGCDTIEAVHSYILQGGDIIYVDEEGLLKDEPGPFFVLNGFHQPLAGNGLVLGTDEEGDSCDAETPIAVIMDAVEFI